MTHLHHCRVTDLLMYTSSNIDQKHRVWCEAEMAVGVFICKGFESSSPPKVPATLGPSRLGTGRFELRYCPDIRGSVTWILPGYVCLTRLHVISPRLLDLSHADPLLQTPRRPHLPVWMGNADPYQALGLSRDSRAREIPTTGN